MCVWFGKWTRFLRRRTQLLGYEGERSGPSSTPRMWDIAPRNGTLDRNAGRNVKRSADVSGNARHFCDGELNYMIREKAVRNESLENPSQCEGFGCGHYNLHKSINTIRHCHIHSLQFWLLTRVPNSNSSLAFPAHLHYDRTNKKKEFSICTKIVFVAIINVFIPVWP